MRIVGWNEFSKLPDGTVYQLICGSSYPQLGPVSVRHAVWEYGGKPSDFVYCEMTPTVLFAYSLGDDAPEGIDDGEEVICHPNGNARDGGGGYSKHRWLVWEDADREKLAAWLLDPGKDMTGLETYLHLPRSGTAPA